MVYQRLTCTRKRWVVLIKEEKQKWKKKKRRGILGYDLGSTSFDSQITQYITHSIQLLCDHLWITRYLCSILSMVCPKPWQLSMRKIITVNGSKPSYNLVVIKYRFVFSPFPLGDLDLLSFLLLMWSLQFALSVLWGRFLGIERLSLCQNLSLSWKRGNKE